MKSLVLFCSLLFCFSKALALNVTFVSPTGDDPFWRQYKATMTSAAKDLEINLSIIDAKTLDRFSHMEALSEAISHQVKPDYLISLFRKNTIEKWLKITQQNNINFIAINAHVSPQITKVIGKPRQKYAHWIAHLQPNDVDAGAKLANILLHAYRNKHANQSSNILALTGSHESLASTMRVDGLKSEVAKIPLASMQQIINTDWSYQDAYDKTSRLLERFPRTNVIWAASDVIALAAFDAAKAKGLSITTGGIDWSLGGIEGFKQNKLLTSIGGHFIEGGMALALVKDHATGNDFKDEIGLSPLLNLSPLTKDLQNKVTQLTAQQQWQRLDFRLLSKTFIGHRNNWSNNFAETIENIYTPDRSKNCCVATGNSESAN